MDLNRYLELKLRIFHKQHNVATISHGLLQATDNLSRDKTLIVTYVGQDSEADW